MNEHFNDDDDNDNERQRAEPRSYTLLNSHIQSKAQARHSTAHPLLPCSRTSAGASPKEEAGGPSPTSSVAALMATDGLKRREDNRGDNDVGRIG